MLSRRTFIKSALATNVAVLATPSHALQLVLNSNNERPLLVFADSSALNSTNFISTVKDQSASIELDIGQHFELLSKFCKESPSGQITGLTRDSDFFVLEQVAKDFGFFPKYSAIHTYDGNVLTHEVTANKKSADVISSSLANAKEDWPTWLADNMLMLPRKASEMVTTKRQLTVSNAKQHNYLVSWSLSASEKI